MKKADSITSLFLLVLSGYFIEEAWRMPPSPTFGPGSGFLPFWLGVAMAVLSVILLIGALRRPPDSRQEVPFPKGKALIRVIAVMGGLGAYIAMMVVLGFLLNTFLFVAYLLGVVEQERLSMTVAVAVLTTAGLYLTFHTVLGIPLPTSIFEF